MPVAKDSGITTGTEPGLRFALVFDGKGGCRELDWAGIASWKPEHGFLWVHLERDDPAAQTWVHEKSGIQGLVALTLLAEESRPRVSDIEDALVIVLRGVNLETEENPECAAELVPIHIWAEAGRVVSLRDKAHQLNALRDIRIALMRGKGPHNAAELIAQIAEKVVDHLELEIDDMEDDLSKLEDACFDNQFDEDCRVDLAKLRRRSTTLRRYIAPQRDALYRLQHDDASWLTADTKARLREVSDKIIRHLEDIDALRDRATILHEDLTARISEKIALTSNRLTGMAALILPPSLIAGMLGVNIEGIPAKDNPWAFPIFCVLMVALMPISWIVLKKLKWI
ncbi:MAG TPA: CorA family divalent cation transporter [Candidatus Sulfotelmatobacter sp.]|jgi:zinc transporter|nr:CorA family divalent cation transporter [Candidatus Sulfotelmatobacter sp.]